MNERSPHRTRFARSTARAGIPAEDWRMCSQIFVEGRRIRTLVADLRDMLSGDLEAPPREAVNEYMEALQRAVALGDIAADTLVAQHAAPHP